MSSLKALQILLVDDNQHMRAITSAVLQSAGVRTVREASDGAAALEMLREHAVDLVIVDFNMFPLDGVEFTRLVRNSPDSANPYLPIIMMTGHSEKARVYEARDAGVNEFVVKPITAKAILDRIQAVIFHPRPFVKTEGYFGPDRRRTNASNYRGPLRRKSDQAAEESRNGPSAA
ncbi:MAG: response regulator [Brevundimonas sp.]|uniref:response regulator n=1 Tax=Brevundimonas sp. TaxID=1871086 RepID=UPI0027165DD7|nr:response regulator [Brevundimonas sp.]MDO9587557.1 response regulator [Brevundimonas sp.]MDP3368825.1 response regulator [Brevundimonas sp.]MDP3655941.1 response regulator [Brevundimonas sp.]MDZ4111646.1 response regulator [Brevundimonas sp.]